MFKNALVFRGKSVPTRRVHATRTLDRIMGAGLSLATVAGWEIRIIATVLFCCYKARSCAATRTRLSEALIRSCKQQSEAYREYSTIHKPAPEIRR